MADKFRGQLKVKSKVLVSLFCLSSDAPCGIWTSPIKLALSRSSLFVHAKAVQVNATQVQYIAC